MEDYLRARQLSATEAAWRILTFRMYERSPAVRRLPVHLDGCSYVIFEEGEEEEAALAVSHLERYFARPRYFTPS